MNESFKKLLHRYNSGACTPEERALVEAWYEQMELPGLPELSEAQLRGVDELTPSVLAPVKTRPLRTWLSAAAAIAITVGACLYFFYQPAKELPTVTASVAGDVLPGSDKAVLTLADGTRLSLSQLENGTLAQQGNVAIRKTTDGELIYDAKEGTGEAGSLYNMVATPRAGQYHLVLADGSEVWLNAASSIKYPTSFDEHQRIVEVTGEAYFEVKHNAAKPFKVVTPKQTVEVLGTHFNINAYADEGAVTTTLLEGSVRVSGQAAKRTVVLKPGQQSTLTPANQLAVSAADIESVMDWKQGDFVFKDQSLDEIMRKVTRWYDVEVAFDSERGKELTFSGVVSRQRKLSAVFKMLERTGTVRFAIQGNRVTVTTIENDN